ncbi:peptidase M15 [Cellulomonas carbonis T26]|uniref:Peptidase M15 n=1 Tax=Cellulomonas carbonis T26 TaxID=947969 RepID=A0A0A0BU79_9CELL|nr:peptidase M15 [Cellulomonas carbonis T26]
MRTVALAAALLTSIATALPAAASADPRLTTASPAAEGTAPAPLDPAPLDPAPLDPAQPTATPTAPPAADQPLTEPEPEVVPEPEPAPEGADAPSAPTDVPAIAALEMPPQGYNGEVRGAVGAWAGFANGRIPASVMCSPAWATRHLFRCDANRALAELNAAYRSAFGVNLSLTSSYRSYDEQVRLKQLKPTLAATPGTSNHGWGLAVDLGGGVQNFGSPQHNWMRANANRFGFFHPRWAQINGSLPEAWHWEYAGAVASGRTDQARGLAMELTRTQPWDGVAERACLGDLWQRASRWDRAAAGAGDLRGIPQLSMSALYGSRWATSSAATTYLQNPQTQIERGLAAVTDRFAGPCRALTGIPMAKVRHPYLSAATVPQGTPVTLRATTYGTLHWKLEVTDARTNVVLHRSSGTAVEGGPGVEATWNGRTLTGKVVGTGPYRFTVTGTDGHSGTPVAPWSGVVGVTGSQVPPVVAAAPLVGDLRFVPITPARVLDTRPEAQSVGPASRLDVVVAGVHGVPADAKAVALNVTAVSPAGPTHLRAWPAGRPIPNSSVLNTDQNRSATAAGVAVGVGGQGKVSLYNDAGSAHLVVDVTGYWTTAGGVGYGALAEPARVLDTRTTGVVPAPGAPVTVPVAGRAGVPADATAVVVNVTSARSRGNGNVAVVPQGRAVTTSTVNHLPGNDVANHATVALRNGRLDVHAAGGTGHVVVDVVGWYGPGGAARFTPIQPTRAIDTRGTGVPVGPADTLTVPVVASTGIPRDAVAAAVTLTATRQSAAATYLTTWGTGAERPGTSVLNTGHGRDQANLAIVRLGEGGSADVYNNAGTTDVVLDVTGYFRRP